jgi:hypothetical protein
MVSFVSNQFGKVGIVVSGKFSIYLFPSKGTKYGFDTQFSYLRMIVVKSFRLGPIVIYWVTQQQQER